MMIIHPTRNAPFIATLVAVICLCLPVASSLAAPIPPGYSAVDQYTEAYPGVGGDRQPPVDDRPGNGGNLPKKTVDRFTKAGDLGVAAAALAAATAPSRFSQGETYGQSPGSGRINNGTGQESARAANQVFGDAGPTGLGSVLPIILITATALAIVYAVRRKRIVA